MNPRKRKLEPVTLGQTLAAHVRLTVWCKGCGHRAEPDVAVQVGPARRGNAGTGLGAAVAGVAFPPLPLEQALWRMKVRPA
jgi:hypothetical protein